MKNNIILCNPRSGSTLLMRLISNSMMLNCVGDRPPQFFRHLLGLFSAFPDDLITYGEDCREPTKVFPDTYCGYDNEVSLSRERYYLFKKLVFVNSWGSYTAMKTTVLGFGNQMTVPFIELAEEILDDDINLVVLQRDPEEIAESLVSRQGGECYDKPERIPRIIELVEQQNQTFREVADMDTAFLTYNKLCEDPMGCLKKINGAYGIAEKTVNNIMEHKVR